MTAPSPVDIAGDIGRQGRCISVGPLAVEGQQSSAPGTFVVECRLGGHPSLIGARVAPSTACVSGSHMPTEAGRRLATQLRSRSLVSVALAHREDELPRVPIPWRAEGCPTDGRVSGGVSTPKRIPIDPRKQNVRHSRPDPPPRRSRPGTSDPAGDPARSQPDQGRPPTRAPDRGRHQVCGVRISRPRTGPRIADSRALLPMLAGASMTQTTPVAALEADGFDAEAAVTTRTTPTGSSPSVPVHRRVQRRDFWHLRIRTALVLMSPTFGLRRLTATALGFTNETGKR